MTKREIIYVALTTINFQTNGYTCIAAGHDADRVESAAYKMIGTSNDIYADTERKNLRIVTRTTAKKLGFDWKSFDPLPPEYGGRYKWVDDVR